MLLAQNILATMQLTRDPQFFNMFVVKLFLDMTTIMTKISMNQQSYHKNKLGSCENTECINFLN